jgi:catechol-2,3-dioxygenase
MRPPVWIGHVDLKVRSLGDSEKFYLSLGLRQVFKNESICILELRGGTHLLLILDVDSPSTDAEFDFMVENIDECYASCQSEGLTTSEMKRGNIHDSFLLTDPSGNHITVNSTHVENHSLV